MLRIMSVVPFVYLAGSGGSVSNVDELYDVNGPTTLVFTIMAL